MTHSIPKSTLFSIHTICKASDVTFGKRKIAMATNSGLHFVFANVNNKEFRVYASFVKGSYVKDFKEYQREKFAILLRNEIKLIDIKTG